MLFRLLAITIFVVFVNTLHAQNELTKCDTLALRNLLNLSDTFEYSNTDSAIAICQHVLEKSRACNQKYFIAESHYRLGGLFDIQGHYGIALNNYLEALHLFEELDIQTRIGGCYNCIGIVLWEQTEGASDSVKIIKLQKAISYCTKGLECHLKTNFKMGLAMCSMNLGILYDDLARCKPAAIERENFSKALDYYHRAIGWLEEINDKRSIGDCYLNMVSMYYDIYLEDAELSLLEYDSINYYNNKAYRIFSEFNDYYGMAMVLKNLSSVNLQFSKNNPELVNTAIGQAKASLAFSDSVGSLFLKYDAYHNLYKAYKQKREFGTALAYHELYQQTKDSVLQMEQLGAIEEMETRYSVTKKELEIQTQKLEIEQAVEKQKKQRIFLIFSIVVLVLISVLLCILIRFNKKKKKINEKLNRQNKTLEQLNSTQTKLMSIISHDLKAPLSAFYSITNSLIHKRDKMTDSDVNAFLCRMLNSSVALKIQLENLLSWAVSQKQSIRTCKTNINLNVLISRNVLVLQEFAKEKGISINNNVKEEVEIYTDGKLLGIVINNLITNAIKFSNRQSEILLTATVENNKTTLSVKDFGIGMDEMQAHYLFADKTEVRKNNNTDTGLGLVVSKDIVENLGGKIWVESTLGAGSEFFVQLPCK